ncbi:putative metacaspase [Trypanosoma cruzi]|uniref:Putative metacaspase n=1 Tax=Trypanosoma cruzi TaxID=5693 RepID=A0A2V2V8J3_TRYCR|nr:putative metacaspase [Trypanosoma cruzi]
MRRGSRGPTASPHVTTLCATWRGLLRVQSRVMCSSCTIPVTARRLVRRATRKRKFDQCLAPVDFSTNGCILDNDIFRILLSGLPQGVRLTVVFDCCHSGSMLDLPYTFVGSRSLSRSVAGHMQRIRKGNDCAGDVLMISGCADEQTSADVSNAATFGTRVRCWWGSHTVSGVHNTQSQ